MTDTVSGGSAPSPSPSVSVLAVKLGPKVANKSKPTVKTDPTVEPTPTVKPTVKSARPTNFARVSPYTPPPSGPYCVINKPCDLSKLTWTITYGCTTLWLANERRTDHDVTCATTVLDRD